MHPQFLFYTFLPQVDHLKTYYAPLVSTKLHPSYHLNSTQPDHAMWQSSPSKSIQPHDDTCHDPPPIELTN